MVAVNRERARKPIAALVLALMFASSLPLTFAQTPTLPGGPSSAGFDLSVKQGEAVIRASDSALSPALKFLQGNRTYHVSFPIYNSGAEPSDRNLPVYYWFEENTTAIERGTPDQLVRCATLSQAVPAGNSTRFGFYFTPPNDVRLDANNEEDWTHAYKLRILVNRVPDTVPQYAHRVPQSCATARYTAPGTLADAPTADDARAQDNMLVAYFVKDARLDLQIDQVKWCRGDANYAAGYDDGTGTYANASGMFCDVHVQDDSGRNALNYTSNMQGPGSIMYNVSRKVEERDCSITDRDCGPHFNVFNGTYFEVFVKNSLENATWADETDYGGPCATTPVSQSGGNWYNLTLSSCPGFEVNVDLRISNLTEDTRASNIVLTNRSLVTRGWTAMPIRSVTWDMVNWTGPFKVFATVNDGGRIPETVATNNDHFHPDPAPAEGVEPQLPYEVASVDFEPAFRLTDLKTTPANPYPYPPQSLMKIAGTFTIQNHGFGVPTLAYWDASGKINYEPKTVHYTIRLDNSTTIVGSSNEVGNKYSTSPWTGTFEFENSTIPETANYLAPGKHSLCITADARNVSRETNKSNNQRCVAIYVADSSAPSFNDIENRLSPRLTDNAAFNGTQLTSLFPGDVIFVHSNATDDDVDNLRVQAQFTLNSNESIVRNYTMARHPSFQTSTFTARITDFNFSTNATLENWTIRVVATDAFGNNATSPPTGFQLKRWPIQTANASHVVLGIPTDGDTGYHPEDSSFDYTDDSVVIRYHLVVNSNQTGIADQPNETANLGMRVFTPNNNTFYVNGSGFAKLIDCPRDDLPVGGTKGNIGCTNVGHFRSPHITKSNGGPGRWYVHLEIMDKGGDIRVVNRTFTLLDSAPSLSDQLVSPLEVEAGQSVNVRVNMTDDFGIDVEGGDARTNFTRRGDNKTYSIPLTGRASSIEGTRVAYAFNNTIETGFGKPLDEAGEYDVTFVARDSQGNWNATSPILFKVNDTRAPDLHEAAIDQTLQEIGVNVTFTARVTDQSNVTVKLRVRPAGSDEDILKVNMTPTAPGSQNFTYETNFTREGNYVWEIHALDSAGLVSSVRSGPLTVSDNLGPRTQIVEPSLLIEGRRYARATPQISLIISDTHGVDRDSIQVDIGGTRVQPDTPVPTGAGLSGYVVNYTVPASLRFTHGDVVPVNVTSVDLSPRALTGWSNFTFTVDDVAPIARVREFTPRYPTDGTGTVNVSLRTRFTLEATDDDNVPTGVESIRYRIFGGGNNAAETVFTEPFTIADAPGVYTGPKVYQVQYWAVDAVGNQKTVGGRPTYETLTVYVDDIPPSLDPFGSLPQGRYVNATFIDDRSGVDRAIVWYSVDNAPYVPVTLDFVAGVWSAVLPEGKRGERVSYYLEVFDRVDNRETFGNATDPYSTYTVGNHAPAIRITGPVEGSRVARTVDLAWTATDEDNDLLVFTVFMKAPGTTAFRELTKLESSDARRYPIVTTNYQDGQYTFRVTVTDGSFVSLADTTVSILNRATAFGAVTPPPGEVEPGTPVTLQVEVTKAEAVVKANLYLDGELVQTVAMNDEARDGDAVARDGKYSGLVELADDGTYRVEFLAQYQEDGEQKTATIAGGEFIVDGKFPLGLWLGILGGVIVIGVVVAAVVIVRGRKGA